MTDYRCTVCRSACTRELLTAKKVQFLEVGKGGRTLRSRTEDWLCPACLKKDPIWNLEAYDSPGMVENNGSSRKRTRALSEIDRTLHGREDDVGNERRGRVHSLRE